MEHLSLLSLTSQLQGFPLCLIIIQQYNHISVFKYEQALANDLKRIPTRLILYAKNKVTFRPGSTRVAKLDSPLAKDAQESAKIFSVFFALVLVLTIIV